MTQRDTSHEAGGVQLEAWRRMGPEGRLAQALELSEAAMAVTRDGIRHRRPELDEVEASDELLRLLGHDEALA